MAHRHWFDGSSLANKGKSETFITTQKKHEQMTYQQQLIEQKKQEIQKRIEEKKRKETEEALKKLNEDKLKAAESSRSKRSYYSYSKRKERPPEIVTPALPANIFKNDGSFLEQFQKISGIKVEVKKKSSENNNDSSTVNDGNAEREEEKKVIENPNVSEDQEKKKERRWSSPDRSQSVNMMQAQTTMPQQVNLHIQQSIVQPVRPPVVQPVQQQVLPQVSQQQQQPVVAQQPQQQIPPMMFPPQMRMPVPPPMFNPPPQFNPMQMMLPPPMAPSSIPPPAPLNPGSIPSPSPLQPYAIPPPSPLMPHSIPPPSPMVPHSIPPPSPLTPHSIPPPMPLRPQNIPPPIQRPPAFLTVPPPPPPPPPPEEEKHKNDKSPNAEADEDTVDRKVNDLFKNEDYSSDDEERNEKKSYYTPSGDHRHSESDSEYDRKSGSYSNKESDAETFNRVDSMSGLDSERGQESQVAAEETLRGDRSYIIIEDTQTQFPSDNNGDPAPADMSSPEDSRPGLGHHSGYSSRDSSSHWQDVKREPEDSFTMKYENDFREKYDMFTLSATTKEIKQEFEDGTREVKTELKQEDSNSQDSTIKTEDAPPRKKRRSRWASSDEKMEMPPVMSVIPPVPLAPLALPPGPPGMPPAVPSMPPRPPIVPPVGMAMPKVLGGVVPPIPPSVPSVNVPGMSGAMISKVTRTDQALVAYAMKAFGRTNLTDAEWKKAEDHYKINLLYQDMLHKREELQRLQAAGKNKYEYDSDEETEGGTWEHKLRSLEMEATQRWADELTEAAKGKHHIGDFLPPDEMARFMEKYEALKQGREPDLSDYKEFKLQEDNVGFQMLQKLGWTEGQGLGPEGGGITDPVNKACMRPEGQGLGMERPEDVDADDDEYDAYRKRMMLAYRFRPNPMNNPRRPYY